MAALRRLDLGCGAAKAAGFLGMDRFPVAGVDVVAEINAPALPFVDDSFDVILAFHSLEHAADLMATMREVWRVGRPGAQVVIVAPYATMQLNLANPYHRQTFNEHTPRFWTNAATCRVDPVEWHQPPLGPRWGLASSDMSDPGFDLRTLRIEFLYFSDYILLPTDEQRRARRHHLDVCEQILYHVAVYKPPVTEADLDRTVEELYMPARLDERRRAAREAASRAGHGQGR